MTAWRTRFFSIWSGQQLSLVGTRATQFALVWWLTMETGSATVLATATMVAFLPQILLGPLIGTAIDRWNRRLVILIADIGVALVSIGLAWLFWTEALQVWHVYVAMLLRALGSTFHHTAMGASTALLVPEEQLARISGLNQTMFGVNGIIGPPLGALLMEWLPLHAVMLVDVITAVPAVLVLLFVPIPQPEADPTKEVAGTSMWQEMAEGMRYVMSWPGLIIFVTCAFLIRFALIPGIVLFPLLVKDFFGRGAPALSLLEAILGAGLICGGLLLTTWGGFQRRIHTAILGFGGLGIGFLLLGATPQALFPMALAAVFVVGTMASLINGPMAAIMQSTVEPRMQGRVMSLTDSLLSISSPLGLAVAGPIGDRLGLPIFYLATGILACMSAITLWIVPAVRRLDEGRPSSRTDGPDA